MGRAGVTLPPLTEVVDISNFSGNAVIDITTIEGLSIKNFTHIQVSVVDAVRSSGTSDIEFDLRPEGGSFGTVSYVWMETSSLNFNRESADFPLTSNTSLTTINGVLWLSSIKANSNSGIRWTSLSAGETNPPFINGMTDSGNQVYDALRFRANGGGGGETWTSGTLVITGYRFKQGAVSIQSLTGAGSTITLDPKTTFCDFFFLNCGISGAAYSGIRIGTGGTPVSANYRAYVMDSIGSGTSSSFGMMACNNTGGATTSRYSAGMLMNMNVAAPPTCVVQDLSNDGTDTQPQEIRHLANANGTTSYDQVSPVVGGGQTWSSGTFKLIEYEATATVLHAGALPAANNLPFTGLKRRNSTLIMCHSYDATRSLATAGVTVFESGSGAYETDADDYDYLRVEEGADTVTTGNNAWITDGGPRAAGGFFLLFAGLPENTHNAILAASEFSPGLSSNLEAMGGRTNTRQTENQFRVRSTGTGSDWISGNAYVVGYS